MTPLVLLVDDDPSVLDALVRALRHEPFALRPARGAREALEALHHSEIAAVVSDESMPGMSGTELLSEVRRLWPETARVVLTGHRDFDTAMRAINLGEVHRYFTKPCNTRELSAALRELLAERTLRRQAHRLLSTVRHQSEVLETIEAETPGITTIEHDDSGSIVLQDDAVDLDGLLSEIEEEIRRAESRRAPGASPPASIASGAGRSR